MTTYDWQVRRWWGGGHNCYSVQCPLCGKRHMLKRVEMVKLLTGEPSGYEYGLSASCGVSNIRFTQQRLDGMVKS